MFLVAQGFFGLEVDNLYNEQYSYLLSGRSHVTACVSRYETFLSFRGKDIESGSLGTALYEMNVFGNAAEAFS